MLAGQRALRLFRLGSARWDTWPFQQASMSLVQWCLKQGTGTVVQQWKWKHRAQDLSSYHVKKVELKVCE